MKSANITREEIFKYAKEKFGTNPEYLWLKSPKNAVLRNNENSKWYAAVLYVRENQLVLPEEEYIDILDVKCDPILICTCYTIVIVRNSLKNHQSLKNILIIIN